MTRSQAETIERFAPTTTAEILLHFEAIEREVARQNKSGVKDLVLFRLKRWKTAVRIGHVEHLRETLAWISGLPAVDYAFARQTYMTAALLIHRAIELADASC